MRCPNQKFTHTSATPVSTILVGWNHWVVFVMPAFLEAKWCWLGPFHNHIKLALVNLNVQHECWWEKNPKREEKLEEQEQERC